VCTAKRAISEVDPDNSRKLGGIGSNRFYVVMHDYSASIERYASRFACLGS